MMEALPVSKVVKMCLYDVAITREVYINSRPILRLVNRIAVDYIVPKMLQFIPILSRSFRMTTDIKEHISLSGTKVTEE